MVGAVISVFLCFSNAFPLCVFCCRVMAIESACLGMLIRHIMINKWVAVCLFASAWFILHKLVNGVQFAFIKKNTIYYLIIDIKIIALSLAP